MREHDQQEIFLCESPEKRELGGNFETIRGGVVDGFLRGLRGLWQLHSKHVLQRKAAGLAIERINLA